VNDAQWEVFSYQGVIAAAVLYFLAMLAYFFELRACGRRGRRPSSPPSPTVQEVPTPASSTPRRPRPAAPSWPVASASC
jgi:hypothetical protein